MTVLDFGIILVAVLLYMALHFPLAYVVIGTLVTLILVRLFVSGERFAVRRPAA